MIVNSVRLRKEYKLIPKSENFKVVFGTTIRLNPVIVYTKLNTWIKYDGDIKDFNDNINTLNSNIRFKIKSELRSNRIFDDTFFFTPNIKKILLNTDSSFHGSFELTLKQNNPINNNINDLHGNIEDILNNIIAVMEKNKYFNFSITKKNSNH